MKEKIIEILKDETKAKSVNEINDKLGLTTVEEIEKLESILEEMTKDGIIHESKKHEFLLMENTKTLKCGRISINRNGNGFVDIAGKEDVFIRSEFLHGAIDGDFVEVDFVKYQGKMEGRVIKILKRDIKNVVGEMIKIKNKLTFKPDNDKLNIVVKLTKESVKQCVEGHKVVVSIIKEIGTRLFLGKVTKIIGHKNDPGIDILSIALRHGIEADFNDSVIKELVTIPNEVNTEELKGRRDLTKEMIFTIDGDDTKDIDDAISLEKSNDNYILGVHIADVSYYVRVGTALYESAYARGSICSLNPEVIRLTISCVMTINSKGKVIDYDIFPSYIKSNKQMTYKNVNKILMEDTIPAGYEPYAEKLREMNELAKILRAEKISRGYIDFGLDEAKIIQDETGKAIDVVKRTRGDGENLIEDFMIAANETVATHINNMDLPFIYRVHDIPSSEKIEDFKNLIKQMGYQIHTNMSKITPITMQKVFKLRLNHQKGSMCVVYNDGFRVCLLLS